MVETIINIPNNINNINNKMSDFITSGTIHSLKSIFQKTAERNVIIDPFSCLIKLSLLRFLDSGTKISIYKNRIHFNAPTYVQGFIRFLYGDNREHLHNLYLPIKKSVEWFWNDKNNDMTYMFNNAVVGLKMLKTAYGNYDTIQHTINYFTIILMQKNANLISKLGIGSLDIDMITNDILDEDSKKTDTTNESENIKNDNNIMNSNKKKQIDSRKQNDSRQQNNNNEDNNIKNNEKIDNGKGNINDKGARESSCQRAEPSRGAEALVTEALAAKDIHKFLFDLWNQREINIVINLYKEMESKQLSSDRDNIYTNIMNYCVMKEDKLYSYIQEHSSIL